ncbi:hypothetical protein K438DRAFT_1799663 [Mycena galopus ATCC 62051]|nr:hypothetical protein K438DRAFT_1820989 [Mycena galopus ATCC 62051]KAF8215895.1 hypothetical protein K438DRAFT_1799663 [Mycena galopus ATCC 62051]
MHCLDRKNPAHLWLLHRLFLEEINEDCKEFQEEWNHHPMSGRTTNEQSPEAMRLLGQTTEGVYKDPMDGIHPDAINRYYGVDGALRRRHRGQTGAGHASDEDDGSDDEIDHNGSHEELEVDMEERLENQIAEDQARNIRHAPIKVARHGSPFEDDEVESEFLELLELVLFQDDLPDDYGVIPAEWDDTDYPEAESIRTGTKGKELLVILPRDEWFHRAVQWAQALDLLNRVLEELED